MSKYNIMVSPQDRFCGAVWLNAIKGQIYCFFLESQIPEESILDYIKNEKNGIIDARTTFAKYTLFNNRSKVEVEGYAFCKDMDGYLPSNFKFWPFDRFKDICKEPTMDSRQFEKVIFVERTVAKEGGAYVSHRDCEDGGCSLGFMFKRWIRCKDDKAHGGYQYFQLPYQEDFDTFKPKNSDVCGGPSCYGSIVPYTDDLFNALINTAMTFKELNERLIKLITPDSLIAISDSGLDLLPLQSKVG